MNENMDKPALKINEVATMIGESPHIVRNWLRDFRGHIKADKSDNGYNLFNEDAIQVIRTIQRLARVQKYSTRQIEFYLTSGGKEYTAAAAEPGELAEIKNMMQLQLEFNAKLLERLDEQRRYIEQSLKNRDDQIMLTIRQLQAAKEEKPSWKFWKR